MLCGLSFRRKKGKKQQHPNKSRTPSPSPEELASCSVRSLPRTPPPTRPAPPPSPPVPTHPVAPVAPEPPGPLTLSSCPVCGRTFVPESLFKHVKICEKMAAKKRKTFDSSRQRREGTDLEQYLPKNFGLPDNSPFLEKSPPCTAKPTPKAKPAAVRHAITKPSAELQRCPHCTRAFGPRAFERHVEWCADKAKILPAAPAQAPARLSDAKQRLNARTQYKAPPVRGRLSSQSRDKCSMSRSTSVDSSRAVSPPRERADSRHERVRASESLSSNDDVSSPHVPVIRTSRGAPAGDAGVRARQARLARDLSSSSSNNIVNHDNLFPSSVKRSSSLLDSIQKKSVSKTDSGKSRHNADLLEQDIMHSLKDFDKFYENESHSVKETAVYNVQIKNGHDTAKRDARAKAEKKNKKNEDVTNGNYTPNTKSTDSAYSSLNRISPSKLSVCNAKESNGMSLEQIPAGSDSSRENDVRSMSSDEFLAMERSAELDEPIMKAPEPPPYKDIDSHKVSEKRSSSRASSRHSGTWQPRLSAELSTSSSDGSLHRRAATPGPRLSRFCHECGSKFPMDTAKFCIECGVKRLAV